MGSNVFMIAEMWWKQNHGTNNKIQSFWELRGLNLKPWYEKKDLSHKMDQNDDSGVALSLLLMRISKLMMTVAKLLLLLLPVKLLPVQVTLKKKWWWVGVENADDVCLIGVCSAAALSAGDDNFVPQKLVVEVQDK